MLFPAGFLTHCSYYKFKIIVLFCQLYNQSYSELISKISSQLCNFCVSIKLHLFCCSALIQQFTSLFNLLSVFTTSLTSKMTFQHFCLRANSTVIQLSTRAQSNTIELNINKQFSDFINDLLQRFRTTV